MKFDNRCDLIPTICFLPQLPDKIELVIWIPLSTQQRELYQQYLATGNFKEIVVRAEFPIEAVTHLKSVCRYPYVLYIPLCHRYFWVSNIEIH